MDMKIDTALIANERQKRAWTQSHLAKASGLGLRTIQRIESIGTASSESALAIAASIEVDIEQLRVGTQKIPIFDHVRLAILGLLTLRASSLADIYRFRGEIARLPFIVCVVFIFVLSFKMQSLILHGLVEVGRSPAEFGNILIGLHWGPYLLVLPLCVARLRGIGWTPALSLVALIPPVTMQIVSLGWHRNNEQVIGFPVWTTNISILSLTCLLLFLLILARWRGITEVPN